MMKRTLPAHEPYFSGGDRMKDILRDERGDLMQQVLIWVLIAVVAIPVLTPLGGAIVEKLTLIKNAITGVNPSTGGGGGGGGGS